MPEKRGQHWDEAEVELVVESYFRALALDLAERSFVKSEIYRDLAQRTGRSTKSIERKFQNVSAVLDELGLEWIRGLAPLNNYQKLLSEKIDKWMTKREFPSVGGKFAPDGMSEEQGLYFEPPPAIEPQFERLPDHMVRLVQKFDPVERDFRNRLLGEAGERFVVESERATLRQQGYPELARKIRWVAKEDGDGAGYDVLSFTTSGREKFLEVKTTQGSKKTPFYLSRNEKEFSDEVGSRYSIIRLFDFRRKPKAYELFPPFERHVQLTTEIFKASFRQTRHLNPS